MPSDQDELHWLETYFILFPQSERPSLASVEKALEGADNRMKLENLSADAEGLIESLLVESPEDHAAVEVSYEVGDAVIEQNLEWAKELQDQLPPDKLQLLIRADARLDVAHFERLPATGSSTGSASAEEPFGLVEDDAEDFDEPGFELLDPTCLLTVVEVLAELTQGLTFDPASGEVID